MINDFVNYVEIGIARAKNSLNFCEHMREETLLCLQDAIDNLLKAEEILLEEVGECHEVDSAEAT